jgi:glycosyltransferase involved in cell wall biosynthesis
MDTRENEDKPSVLLSHATGNQNVRNALRSLSEHGMLAEFWTSIAWDIGSRWKSVLPASVRSQFCRRAYPEAPASKIKAAPWREIVKLAARSTPMQPFLSSGERPFSEIGVSRYVDGRVARRLSKLRPNVVYASEGCALRTFREAKKLDVVTVYELPSSYWYWEHKLYAEDAKRSPEFANLLASTTESSRNLEEKDEELSLADYLFVPSEHVRRTLAGVVPNEKIRVVSFGAPPVRYRSPAASNPSQPLKILFAGSLIQRKGIGYLLEAIEMLGPKVELTMVGSRIAPNRHLDAACKRWRWFKSLPHDQVLDLMMESDVLALPSLSDGWGLVVTEALACGLPVIVTPNAGVSQIVHDNHDGYIVPVCRADAIAERLEAIYLDREKLAAMSRQAQLTAAANPWENYRTNFARVLRDLKWQ